MKKTFFFILKNAPVKLRYIFRNRFYARYFGHKEFVIGENVILAGFKKNIHLGKRCGINSDTKIFASTGEVSIGDDVSINMDCLISAEGSRIVIGNDTLLAPRVMIICGGHYYNDKEKLIRLQEKCIRPISIGSDVWIGAGAIILSGVTVGDGSVVAAGAVVTKDLPPFSVAAGVPARVIKRRGEQLIV